MRKLPEGGGTGQGKTRDQKGSTKQEKTKKIARNDHETVTLKKRK
jgi:hypothetical protein